MANDRTYYCVCDDNCRFETMTKEQILAAITEAVESHTVSDVNTGFVTSLKEQNANAGLKVWVGTQAQYNAIATKAQNCLYIITDEDGLQPIDISDSVTLTCSGATLTVEGKKYRYNKTTGIVNFNLMVYLEDISADTIKIVHGGSYAPSDTVAVYFDRSGFTGKYIASTGIAGISINLSARTDTSLLISGWYYYDEQ